MLRFLALGLVVFAVGCSASGPGTETPPVPADAGAPVEPAKDNKGREITAGEPVSGTGLSNQ